MAKQSRSLKNPPSLAVKQSHSIKGPLWSLLLAAVGITGTVVLWPSFKDTQLEDTILETLVNDNDGARELVRSNYTNDAKECMNEHEKCEEWAERGECEANPVYMLSSCKKSCMICGDVEFDMGVKQKTSDQYQDTTPEGNLASLMASRMTSAVDYVTNTVAKDADLRPVLEGCKLNHEECLYWSVMGECETSAEYMHSNCAPLCETCDMLSIEKRCPIDLETMPDVWKPGDLNEFFTNITMLAEYQQYEPTVLSRPAYLEGDSEENADYKIGPWVVVLENLMSQEEADRMIELGALEGYKRSHDVGKLHFDGSFEQNENDGRTSTNAWCQDKCASDPVGKRVIDRVANITNIPQVNSENLQLLKYEVGQFYQLHHDYIPHYLKRQAGVRILTVFLYLNEVEEGGGTSFPLLDLTVEPKRGRALIWPSVLDEDPHMKDPRTDHQALPVIKGVKYGANAWIHQRDFITPSANNCDP